MSNIWNDNKGLSDFITLSREPDFIVVLVGLKPTQVRILQGEEYKDCNIVPVCRTQNQKELAMIYSLADVFINPTYADMFPTVNLEALACGTPVITYRTGGSPEAVEEKTGIVVEQGGIDALVDAIRKMKAHPLSPAACRKRAEEHFDKDKCFEKYIELYNQILNEE